MYKKKELDLFRSNYSANKHYEYLELQAYKQIAIGYFFIFFGTSVLIITFFNIINFFMN
jgi:hypothetical protein